MRAPGLSHLRNPRCLPLSPHLETNRHRDTLTGTPVTQAEGATKVVSQAWGPALTLARRRHALRSAFRRTADDGGAMHLQGMSPASTKGSHWQPTTSDLQREQDGWGGGGRGPIASFPAPAMLADACALHPRVDTYICTCTCGHGFVCATVFVREQKRHETTAVAQVSTTSFTCPTRRTAGSARPP